MPDTTIRGRSAFGTKLYYSADNGSTYTAVPGLKNIDGPEQATAEIEITNHDSPNRTREYDDGLQEPGTLTFSGNYVVENAVHSSIRTYKSLGTILKWKIVYTGNSGKNDTFDAFVMNYKISSPYSDAATWTVSLKLASELTMN